MNATQREKESCLCVVWRCFGQRTSIDHRALKRKSVVLPLDPGTGLGSMQILMSGNTSDHRSVWYGAVRYVPVSYTPTSSSDPQPNPRQIRVPRPFFNMRSICTLWTCVPNFPHLINQISPPFFFPIKPPLSIWGNSIATHFFYLIYFAR